MKLFGLTGGIGMGKSTSAALLSARGIPVIDTDVVAREFVEPGQPALAEIAQAFGPAILDETGRLRRGVLGERVFGDAAQLRKLEAILHPRIRAHWQARVAAWRAEARRLAVVVIPLLFETSAAGLFDAIVCTACSAPTQRERLLARGWSERQIEQRTAAQWPTAQKIEQSNYVVWTEGVLPVHARQVECIFRDYLESRR